MAERIFINTKDYQDYEQNLLSLAEQLINEGDIAIDLSSGDVKSIQFLIKEFNLPTEDVLNLITQAILLYQRVYKSVFDEYLLG